jgi:hypothetical protein
VPGVAFYSQSAMGAALRAFKIWWELLYILKIKYKNWFSNCCSKMR